MDESVRKAVLSAVPSLRAFAISLCGNVDRADDLVQETLLRAWRHPEALAPERGSPRAWLRTVARNIAFDDYRDEPGGRRIGETDHEVDRFQRGNDLRAFAFHDNRSTGALDSAHGRVAVDGYDEHIPQCLGLRKKTDVADVQQVEAPVGEDERLARLPQPLPDVQQLRETHDLRRGLHALLERVTGQHALTPES